MAERQQTNSKMVRLEPEVARPEICIVPPLILLQSFDSIKLSTEHAFRKVETFLPNETIILLESFPKDFLTLKC